MRSILQFKNYLKDSQKLLKSQLVKIRSMGNTRPKFFKKNYHTLASIVTSPVTAQVLREYFIKRKNSYLVANTSFKNFGQVNNYLCLNDYPLYEQRLYLLISSLTEKYSSLRICLIQNLTIFAGLLKTWHAFKESRFNISFSMPCFKIPLEVKY